MPAHENRLGQAFSLKHFIFGLTFVVALCLLLAGYAVLMKNRTLEELRSRLAAYTVAVEHASNDSSPPETVPKKDPQPAPPSTPPDSPQEKPLSAASAGKPVFSILPASKSLPAAPADGMTEESVYGVLPVMEKTGKTPFTAYRKPALINRDRPILAVAITDYGLSDALSEKVLNEIPAEASLILNPYAAQADLWQKKAREHGHEVWLQLFTVTKSFPFRDPGAKGLLTDASLKYNQERLYWMLGRTTGYAGLAAYTDSAMSAGAPMFKTLSAEIFRRGLGYIEINPGRDSFLIPLAIDEKAPNAQVSFTLDASGAAAPDTNTIEKHLRDHGGALVTIRATPGNIAFLKTWLTRIQERGINIVPASALAEIGREE